MFCHNAISYFLICACVIPPTVHSDFLPDMFVKATGPKSQSSRKGFWLVLAVVEMSPFVWFTLSVVHSCRLKRDSSAV